MKTYKVKNYKGNLVESLSKFQKIHKGMRIVEAVEDEEELKIKVTEADNLISTHYFYTTSKNDLGDNLKFFYFKNEKDVEEFLKAIEDDGYKIDAKEIREDIKQEKIDFPICIYYSDNGPDSYTRDSYTFSSEISEDKNKMKKDITKALGKINKRLQKIEQVYKEKQKEIKDSEKYGNELLEML